MKVLVVVEADPRVSHKTAEAFRVALGLSSGPLEVEVVLRGEARRAFDEDVSGFVDADVLEANRSRLERAGVPVHVDAEPPEADRVIVFT